MGSRPPGRAVIGDVAAAVGGKKAIPGAGGRPGRQQVVEVAVAAEGDDVRMLDDEQLIGDEAELALFDEIALHGERAGVLDASEIVQLAATH